MLPTFGVQARFRVSFTFQAVPKQIAVPDFLKCSSAPRSGELVANLTSNVDP